MNGNVYGWTVVVDVAFVDAAAVKDVDVVDVVDDFDVNASVVNVKDVAAVIAVVIPVDALVNVIGTDVVRMLLLLKFACF